MDYNFFIFFCVLMIVILSFISLGLFYALLNKMKEDHERFSAIEERIDQIMLDKVNDDV